jgi:hypothetical protein
MEGRTQWCVTGLENQPNVNSVEGSTPLPSAKFWVYSLMVKFLYVTQADMSSSLIVPSKNSNVAELV